MIVFHKTEASKGPARLLTTGANFEFPLSTLPEGSNLISFWGGERRF